MSQTVQRGVCNAHNSRQISSASERMKEKQVKKSENMNNNNKIAFEMIYLRVDILTTVAKQRYKVNVLPNQKHTQHLDSI